MHKVGSDSAYKVGSLEFATHQSNEQRKGHEAKSVYSTSSPCRRSVQTVQAHKIVGANSPCPVRQIHIPAGCMTRDSALCISGVYNTWVWCIFDLVVAPCPETALTPIPSFSHKPCQGLHFVSSRTRLQAPGTYWTALSPIATAYILRRLPMSAGAPFVALARFQAPGRVYILLSRTPRLLRRIH